MTEYFGKCPLCENKLFLEAGLLICPAGDYKAEGEAFESRWQRYDEDSKHGASREMIDALLSDLRSLNQVGT